MSENKQCRRKVTIENRLGFHVRPVQRFSELARAFNGSIEVKIGDKNADGKSVMGLMSLGAQSGSEMEIITRGADAEQAVELLSFVVLDNFFVEEKAEASVDCPRHIDRLVKFSRCFKSDIFVEIDGDKIDAQDADTLMKVGLEPTTPVEFCVTGEDEEQARKVLEKLADYCFYVEEAMGAKTEKGR